MSVASFLSVSNPVLEWGDVAEGHSLSETILTLEAMDSLSLH